MLRRSAGERKGVPSGAPHEGAGRHTGPGTLPGSCTTPTTRDFTAEDAVLGVLRDLCGEEVALSYYRLPSGSGAVVLVACANVGTGRKFGWSLYFRFRLP